MAEQDKIDEKAKDLPDLDPARGRRWDWEKEDLKIEPPPEDEKKPEK